MKNKNGFTLIELLAVIVILTILVIIAVPNILKLYNDARINNFITEARIVYKESKKNILFGSNNSYISSKDDTKLDIVAKDLDYCVILDNNGEVDKIAVGNNNYYII